MPMARLLLIHFLALLELLPLLLTLLQTRLAKSLQQLLRHRFQPLALQLLTRSQS